MKLIILIMVACVPSFGAQENTSDSTIQPQKVLTLSSDLILLDHWFFKGHSDKCGDLERAEPNIIKIGECFGFALNFYTTRPTLKIHIEFRMPGVPDHFNFDMGKVTFSQDHKTAIVDVEAKTEKGHAAYYLHKDKGDTTGPEEISFSVEGVQIETYKFIVTD